MTIDFDWKPLALVPLLALGIFPFIGSGSTWLTLTVAGLAMGMIIFIIASGLTLVFGLMDVLNFGHGVFIALGAFVATTVLGAMSDYTQSESMMRNMLAVLPAMLVAMLVASAGGLAFERFIVRPVYGNHLKQILITVGGAIIGEELTVIRQEFGQTKLGARRSEIEHNAQDLATEDLITPTDMVVTLSHSGYIKSQPLSEYRAQKRGGRGKQATATKEDDWVDQLFIANTHDWILCFSNRGRLYWLKVWEVPAGSRGSRGRPIVNMFPLQDGEKINVVLPLTGDTRSFPADHFIFMGTSMGTVKKTALDEFNNPRKGGIIAVNLDEGDYLIGAALTDGKHDVMLFSDGGKAVRFDENDVRVLGRNTRGVRGMDLPEGQSVIAMLVAEDEQQSVLTATVNGYGKRTPISEYTRHGRGTKGMIAIQQSERNGKVVAATLVHADDEIMLITDKGVLVRTRVSEIRELGRATQGVTLIGLDEGSKLSGLQRIVENDAQAAEGDPENGEAAGDTPGAAGS